MEARGHSCPWILTLGLLYKKKARSASPRVQMYNKTSDLFFFFPLLPLQVGGFISL